MPTKRKTEPTESAIVKQIAKFLESLGAKVLKTSGSSTGLTIGAPDVLACVPVAVWYAERTVFTDDLLKLVQELGRPVCELGEISDLEEAPAPKSLFLALEVKRPSKRSAVTVIQRKQLLDWRTAGAIAGVVTSVDDVRELLGIERSDA